MGVLTFTHAFRARVRCQSSSAGDCKHCHTNFLFILPNWCFPKITGVLRVAGSSGLKTDLHKTRSGPVPTQSVLWVDTHSHFWPFVCSRLLNSSSGGIKTQTGVGFLCFGVFCHRGAFVHFLYSVHVCVCARVCFCAKGDFYLPYFRLTSHSFL